MMCLSLENCNTESTVTSPSLGRARPCQPQMTTASLVLRFTEQTSELRPKAAFRKGTENRTTISCDLSLLQVEHIRALAGKLLPKQGQRNKARPLSSCGSFLVFFYNCPNVELGRTAVPQWPLTLGLRGSIAQSTVLEAGSKASDFLSFFFCFL